MARTRYGFTAAPGTNYAYGDEPTIAQRLGNLARALHIQLVGISGYRTPAHSVAVGGFANDPHTRGQASDTQGAENIPETTLERFGLTRPLAGVAEANHIQLFGKNTRGRHHIFSIADLWVQAGGPRNLAPTMAAIALAESGGRVDAVGGPNSDGTYDYGLFQINSSHSQFDANKLVSDAAYNARAAVSVWRSQGLTAWSTYTSGAYKSHMGQTASTQPTFGRTRPGGGTGGGSGDEAANTFFADYLNQADGSGNENVVFGIPGTPNIPGVPNSIPGIPSIPGMGAIIPNPLKLFTDPMSVVKDVNSFFHFVAWIFHPVNILRMVEFLTGVTLMVMGIHTAIEVHKGAEETSVGRGVKKAAGEAVAITPVGRAARVAKGARAGRTAAKAAKRRKEFEGAYKRGKRGESRRKEQRATDKRFGKNPPF